MLAHTKTLRCYFPRGRSPNGIWHSSGRFFLPLRASARFVALKRLKLIRKLLSVKCFAWFNAGTGTESRHPCFCLLLRYLSVPFLVLWFTIDTLRTVDDDPYSRIPGRQKLTLFSRHMLSSGDGGRRGRALACTGWQKLLDKQERLPLGEKHHFYWNIFINLSTLNQWWWWWLIRNEQERRDWKLQKFNFNHFEPGVGKIRVSLGGCSIRQMNDDALWDYWFVKDTRRDIFRSFTMECYVSNSCVSKIFIKSQLLNELVGV